MALTKQDLVEIIQKKLAIDKNKANIILKSLFEIIKTSLENEEEVKISKFGKFYVQKWNRRCGRNPQNGKQVFIENKKIVKFKTFTELKSRLNKKKKLYKIKKNYTKRIIIPINKKVLFHIKSG